MIRQTLSLLFEFFGKKKPNKEKCVFSLYLPDEVKLHIFSFLTVKELCDMASVSRDFKILALDDSLWRRFFVKVALAKDPPPARVCHSAVVYGERMYVYGGHVPDALNFIRDVKNDFYAYHFATKKWEAIVPRNGSEPLPYKTEHTAVIYKNSMYLFGGYSNGTLGYRDVSIYEYNFDTRTCVRVDAGGTVPPDRSAHTAVVYKDNMYILGGWDGTVSNNDFYMFHFETRTWSEVEYEGLPPPFIRSHSAVVYNDSMVVFGGYGENIHPTSIFIFHFPTKRWDEIKASASLASSLSLPSPGGKTASSSYGCVSSSSGGGNTAGSSSGEDDKDPYSSLHGIVTGPCGRSRFRMVYYQQSLWVFGGWDRKSYFADLWRFRLDTRTWHKIDAFFDLKGVGQHSLVVHQGRMYLYGGYCADSKAPHPHLYIYKLPNMSCAEA